LRILAKRTSFCLAVQFFFWSPAAHAATLSYTPPSATAFGSVQCSVPVSRIGPILLADSVLILNGSSININAKEKNNPQASQLLAGILINPVVVGKGKHGKMTSICYFREGPLLEKIDVPRQIEDVDLTDGSTVAGRLTSVGSGECTIETPSGQRQKHIPTSQIKHIHSPRAYEIRIPVQCTTGISPGQALECKVSKFTLSPTVEPAPAKAEK
jgi:hypothetical protein